jgi:hypothetical protein
MRSHRALRVLKIAVFVVAGSALLGFVVMALWNWLVPAVFGWHRINFLQAWGLFLLSKILFGGFHGRPGHRGQWKHRMKERWESMTPEEREKFQERMRTGCGRFRPSAEPRPEHQP